MVERRAVLLQIVVFVEWSRGRRVHERYLYTCRTAGWSLGAVEAIEQRNSSLFSFWANFGRTSCKKDEEPNKRPGSSKLSYIFSFLSREAEWYKHSKQRFHVESEYFITLKPLYQQPFHPQN